jgi:hypothetical protein
LATAIFVNKGAVHLKDEPPQARKRRKGGILNLVFQYHPKAGAVKKKVLHSGNGINGQS